MASFSSAHGRPFHAEWDPKDLEIRTKSVEKILEPLVTQVTTFINQKGPGAGRRGQSRKAYVLSAAVQQACEQFIQVGLQIAKENQDIEADMMKAVDDIRITGEDMRVASEDFADDPCSSLKRGAVIRTARALLSAVTRLLIIADMVDVHLLLKSLRLVEDDLNRIRIAQSQMELISSFKDFGHSVLELNDRAGQRQMDLKDERRRDDLAAARATLKKNSIMLLTASKTYVRHPELAAARANRDYVLKQVCDAVNVISDVAQAKGASDIHPYETIGELAFALDEFDRNLILEPASYGDSQAHDFLKEQLESIIGAAALMADSSCTRDQRRERIVQECTAVRQALQNLLQEYMNNSGRTRSNEALDNAQENVSKRMRSLRKQLRHAVVDHISDTFLDPSHPLLQLINAARSGNESELQRCVEVFQEHCSKVIEVANLACSMSNNEEGIKMVRMAANQIDLLCPQMINASHVQLARPKSKVASENLDVFKEAWLKQMIILTEAIDDITNIDDFLAVAEGHVQEDMARYMDAFQRQDGRTLDGVANLTARQCDRICNFVDMEMMRYEPGPYTDRVMQSVNVLRNQIVVEFSEMSEQTSRALNYKSPYELDRDAVARKSDMVIQGVGNIRKYVSNRPYGIDIEPDEPELGYETRPQETGIPPAYQDDIQYEESTDRAMMRHLPEEQRIKIQEQVKLFRMEKAALDREVAKWDDSGNDIIVIAKQMCVIMMEMTDFTRGQGPLKSTGDVINAAKKISEAGAKLDSLCKQIADQCPDSASKKDLLAYLQRIALYCHQLNITSKVKSDVQNISGELVVSGLDSATSLIQAAKNLMNSVVLAVKASYVASTKYTRATGNRVVTWQMKVPDKKPLVNREQPEESWTKVRKAEKKKNIEPVRALSEFHA